MSQHLLAGKVAVVTGGGTGIGRATAEAMAAAGAKVVIGNRDAALGGQAVDAIKTAGGEAVFVPTDVTKSDQVERLVAEAVRAFGRLDCAFNNAGFEGKTADLAEQTEEDFDRVVAVNFKGVFLCMKHQIGAMLRTGGGAVVNNSSIFGLNGYPGWAIYSATKHAVSGLTKSAALEYAKRGVRVNAVGPGPILTPLLEKGTGATRTPTASSFR
ncbi:MAG: SDR family NAD(P)-dependent oxidoreductase [Gemmataceae bacterium]|nr:SDR family NAD(P)-dependent oxidoreductase [Gemmataceae bacterium]